MGERVVVTRFQKSSVRRALSRCALVLLLVSGLSLAGCDLLSCRTDSEVDEGGEAVGNDAQSEQEHAEESPGAGDEPAPDPLAPPPRELLPMPPRRVVESAASGATVHEEAANIVAGDMRLEIRANSLRQPTTIQVSTRAVDELDVPLPPGLILGAASGSPLSPEFSPIARWLIPLEYQVAPEQDLEILAWHDNLGTWLTLGPAQANRAGTHAVFLTTVLGDVVIRARPEVDSTRRERCDVDTFNLGDEHPTDEGNAVGYTPRNERYERVDALAYLSDVRLLDVGSAIEFKNEETIDTGRWRGRDERNHQDEDFFMDPNAAAALAILHPLVAADWYDPFTGEPAVSLRVTDAYDSLIEHSPVSTHYQGRGVDLTLNPVPTPNNVSRRAWYGRLSALAVCAGFDYSYFENRFHVHASVLPTRVAALLEDSSGRRGVFTGRIGEPQRWELVGNWIESDGLDAERLAWTGWSEIQVYDASGGGFTLTTEGERRELSVRDAEGLRVSADGLRELRVTDGALYIVNTNALVSRTTQNAAGEVLAQLQPAQMIPNATLEAGTYRVLDAVFQPHSRSSEVRERFGR